MFVLVSSGGFPGRRELDAVAYWNFWHSTKVEGTNYEVRKQKTSVAGMASLHTKNGELTQLDLWFKQEARPDDS